MDPQSELRRLLITLPIKFFSSVLCLEFSSDHLDQTRTSSCVSKISRMHPGINSSPVVSKPILHLHLYLFVWFAQRQTPMKSLFVSAQHSSGRKATYLNKFYPGGMKIKVWLSAKASIYQRMWQWQEVERAGSGWLKHHI